MWVWTRLQGLSQNQAHLHGQAKNLTTQGMYDLLLRPGIMFCATKGFNQKWKMGETTSNQKRVHSKGNHQHDERQSTEWEKILAGRI